MKRLFSQLHRPLRNERGEITFFACFFVVGVVMLISFLLLYASVRITCINIRNGAKMELNNLSATIYADTYRSQRETNFEEYLRTLYSSRDYTEMLEATVAGGLAEEQIDHAHNGTIPCPHCGRWSEFIVLGIRLQPEPLVPCLNCDCHDPDMGCTMPSIDKSYACPLVSCDDEQTEVLDE